MKEGQGWPLCSGPAAGGRRAPTAVGKPVGRAGSDGQTLEELGEAHGPSGLSGSCPRADRPGGGRAGFRGEALVGVPTGRMECGCRERRRRAEGTPMLKDQKGQQETAKERWEENQERLY